MEGRRSPLNARDRLYLERAYELAARAIGSTSPNPPVGAVLVRDGAVIGEGYHHRSGAAHAEVEALAQAGSHASGATLYVSLEPCNHHGKTPPCSQAVIAAGVRRVVFGTLDPNPKTAHGGVETLRAAGIEVCSGDEKRAKKLIEPFTRTIVQADRPYVSLKMASSIDGFIAPVAGVQHWLTGPQSKDFVRDLRIAHDAVVVGAGTVRVDDPQLTVRPAHDRLRPYTRIVMCETDSVPKDSRIFAKSLGYAPTLVVAPGGQRARFASVEALADVVYVGDDAQELDIVDSMRALRQRGIQSVLCEGGPTLAGRLLALGLVDRFYWLMAPVMLGPAAAGVRVLNVPSDTMLPSITFDAVEQLGPDLLLSGTVMRV
ncbi:MAG: bifunctional diaminohydroxyphosphoribosylaminopyrimidine deaminase/5-amino-6-(5-phosphoribosylamino)uracil reductase RibD [Candidatus Eremiobacteraeota bacterium]|nr:bifunctional diaminohydroxyphosphoribosylaminopyrimidine deaminase/5-amino-6-(5-phosphoribosylamino)uracil reductase RibD [Candidatus Eremiobacteraeota bacterium]